jgi:glycerol-3-phosphate dehydrogenase (NAD(P)+)
LCADCGHDVSLWARDAALIDAITRDRRNPRFLKDVAIPDAIRATTDLAEALADCEMVIIAVPSHAVRDVMARAAALLPAEQSSSRRSGISLRHGKTMDEVIAEVLPSRITRASPCCRDRPSRARSRNTSPPS